MWKATLWRQFGAAIDMLESTLRACPDVLWNARLCGGERPELQEFWYVGYHTLFWLACALPAQLRGSDHLPLSPWRSSTQPGWFLKDST
jgi:hypothetical protein